MWVIAQRSPEFFGASCLHSDNLLLTCRRWVRQSRGDFSGLHNVAFDCFCRDESATAIDICALMIPLFCGIRKIATRAGVSGVMAFRAVKLPLLTSAEPCQPSHSVSDAPHGGNSISPSVLSSAISSWSASNPRWSDR